MSIIKDEKPNTYQLTGQQLIARKQNQNKTWKFINQNLKKELRKVKKIPDLDYDAYDGYLPQPRQGDILKIVAPDVYGTGLTYVANISSEGEEGYFPTNYMESL